jgi:hypothetical protein
LSIASRGKRKGQIVEAGVDPAQRRVELRFEPIDLALRGQPRLDPDFAVRRPYHVAHQQEAAEGERDQRLPQMASGAEGIPGLGHGRDMNCCFRQMRDFAGYAAKAQITLAFSAAAAAGNR